MDISWHFLTNVQHTYDLEKKSRGKDDVSTTGTGGGGGEDRLQDGFGWTNGVTLKMLDLICPKEQPCENVPVMRPTVKSATTQPSTKVGTTHTLTSAYSTTLFRLLRMALW
ncbi:trehalase family glycosidase [Escherichia coli]